ncbi:surface anchored protein [Streptococcus pseudopneumoniae]|nr:surface anchored protein [Streptococcus pseudopneumoniae]
MDKKVSMSRSERLRREKVTRYSIRKYSFGAASVAVAALFMFLGNGAVSAAENGAGSQDGTAVAANPNGGGGDSTRRWSNVYCYRKPKTCSGN